MTITELKSYLRRGPYAWPGGYPYYFIMADGCALAFTTALTERKEIFRAMTYNHNKAWIVVAIAINWEGTTLYDAHTGEKIESAYGEDNE
jgi:hypothetical protein